MSLSPVADAAAGPVHFLAPPSDTHQYLPSSLVAARAPRDASARSESDTVVLTRYQDASRYLNEQLIRASRNTLKNHGTRLSWMQRWLPRIDHPEQAYPAIHVAATSGKGSISTMLAEILRAAKIRTGLHTSPYLQVQTEKLWVDGHYASVDEFADLVDWIRPIADAEYSPEAPRHGLASVAITLEHFRRNAVQLAVMETGVGGRDDLTNVMQTCVGIVGSIGLDHQRSLGNTLEEIAAHKVGILRPPCRAVVWDHPVTTAAAITQLKNNAVTSSLLRRITPQHFHWEASGAGRGYFSFFGDRLPVKHVPLAMPGPFQAQNAALAVAALEELQHCEQLNFDAQMIRPEHVAIGLSRARLPGRMEWMPEPNRSVLLDGAHNVDKLNGLADALRTIAHRHVIVIYGAIAGRDSHERPLSTLFAQAQHVYFTEPQVYGKPAVSARELRAQLASLTRNATAQPDPDVALNAALDAAGPDDLIVVTGSLYLVGNLRRRWFGDEQVLKARQSWY